MATLEPAPAPAVPGPDPSTTLRQLKHQATRLLPAALAFLGFQIFVLTRGTLRSGLLEQLALFAAVICAAGSVVLLVLLLSRRVAWPTPDLGQQEVRTLGWTLAASTAVLLFGASIDVGLATEIVSNSWTIGAILGGLLMAIACQFCW